MLCNALERHLYLFQGSIWLPIGYFVFCGLSYKLSLSSCVSDLLLCLVFYLLSTTSFLLILLFRSLKFVSITTAGASLRAFQYFLSYSTIFYYIFPCLLLFKRLPGKNLHLYQNIMSSNLPTCSSYWRCKRYGRCSRLLSNSYKRIFNHYCSYQPCMLALFRLSNQDLSIITVIKPVCYQFIGIYCLNITPFKLSKSSYFFSVFISLYWSK